MSVSSTISNIVNTTKNASKLKKGLAGLGLGGVATAGFCVFDFLSVPGAFKLDYNTKGEKVDGVNWKSGLKELGKSTIKCLSYLAVPAAVTALFMGTPAVIAALGGVAALGSSFVLSSLFEKLLPEEQKLVAEACRQKGIDINADKKEFLA